MDEQELALRERQLRRCRTEGCEDYTPISVPLTDLEQLVAEVRRLQGVVVAARGYAAMVEAYLAHPGIRDHGGTWETECVPEAVAIRDALAVLDAP